MELIPLEQKSGNIAATGHEGDTMHVQFLDGRTYAHSPVTAEAHAALRAAPSAGSHYHQHFSARGPAKGKYQVHRV